MKKRIIVYDVIRVFAIMGVVATHAEAITSSPTNYLGGLSWWFANTIHSLVSVSVPLFILLTGALVLHKEKVTYKYIWPKVTLQFVFPLLVWWLFYSWWTTYRLGFPWDAADLAKRFFFTDVGHLYFLQIIIGLYGIMPILHRFLHIHSRTKQYFSLGTITFLSALYEYLSFVVFKTYNSTNIFVIFLPFLTYVLWGYYLAKVTVKPKQWWLLLCSAIGLVGAISVASYLNTLALIQGFSLFWTPSGGNLFWEPFTVPIVLLSGIIFVLLVNIQRIFPKIFANKKMMAVTGLLSTASFGIYIIHPFLMEQIDHYFHFSIHFISYPLWIYYIQRTIYAFVTSSLIVFAALKIPYLKSIFGARPIH